MFGPRFVLNFHACKQSPDNGFIIIIMPIALLLQGWSNRLPPGENTSYISAAQHLQYITARDSLATSAWCEEASVCTCQTSNLPHLYIRSPSLAIRSIETVVSRWQVMLAWSHCMHSYIFNKIEYYQKCNRIIANMKGIYMYI